MSKLPIARAKLAGKRRMAIYTHDLADYSGLPLSILINELNASELRQDVDYIYNPRKDSFALSLASAQALLITSINGVGTNNHIAWQTWHAITDYIQGTKE